MAQDNSIDTRLPYRIGYPKLPALPVCSKTPVGNWGNYIPNISFHAQRISAILEDYEVNCCNFQLEHRFNDGHEYDQNMPTIILLAYFRPTSEDTIYNNGWIQGVMKIRQVLHAAEIYNPVELIDPKAYSNLLFPWPVLSTDHEIIEESKAIMPDVLHMISKQDWIAIDVFKRDYPHTSQEPPMVVGTPFFKEDGSLNYPDMPHCYQKPTLIISARDANEDVWWDSILPQLRRKMQNLDIVLLFLQDIMLTAKPGNISTLFRSAYHASRAQTIFMGDSCAPKGSTSSCTLGGKIRLKDGAHELEMGLTNCQGLLDESKQAVTIRYGETDSPREIVSISDEDHAYVQTELQKSIKEEQTILREQNEKLKSSEEGSRTHHSTLVAISEAEQEIKYLERHLEKTKTFSRNIGTVFADSGFRIRNNPIIANPSQFLEETPRSERWLLDWGLIQINSSKTVSSKLQSVPLGDEDSKKLPKTYLSTDFDVTEYATISPDDHLDVMKRGRTTVWTHGVMSAIKGIQRRITPTLARDTIEEFKNVACYSIIAQPNPQYEFIEPGDSGCFVLLNEKSNPGVIIGLGFANNPSVYASYMLPMDLVVLDIEESTGMEVLEPKYAGVVSKV
jgi:hypothetical protein